MIFIKICFWIPYLCEAAVKEEKDYQQRIEIHPEFEFRI